MSGAFKLEVARFNYVGTAVTSRTVPVTAAVAIGDTVVLAVDVISGSGSNTTVSVSDGHGNTYTFRKIAVQGPGNAQSAIVICDSITTALTTSDNWTVTADVGGSTWLVLGYTYTGLSSFDVAQGGTGTTSSMSSGATATAAQDSQLVVGAFGYTGTGVVFTPGAGFTAQTVLTTAGTVRNLQVEWVFVNTSGTRTATASMDASHGWGAVVAAVNVSIPPAVTFVKTVTVG